MRVLVVHNRYSSRVPSGENLAVDDEVRWLREAGVDVETFEVSNDDVFGAGPVAKARQAAESVWSLSAQRKFAAALDRINPELVHVHNLFPLLTASVPRTALRRHLPVVWTVHNRRLTCVIGTNFRDGRPCHDCRSGRRLSGIRHACYGGSPVASGLVTGATAVYGRMARRRVTAIAVSRAMRDWLVESAGFPDRRVHLRHNAVAGPRRGDALASPTSSRTFLFVGYLTDYKGVRLLLDAWRQAALPPDVVLQVVGDGPLVQEVEAAAAVDARIRCAGHLPPTEVAEHLSRARAVVVPSCWDEPFGRTAAEALAYGRPVISTGSGGLVDVVTPDCGWVTGGQADALTRALEDAVLNDDDVEKRASAARRRYDSLFSPAAATAELLRIYETALAG